MPFYMQKNIHLKHHEKLNEADDPNLIYAGGPFWQLPLRYFKTISYMNQWVKTDPRTANEKRSDQTWMLVAAVIYAIAFFAGFFKEILLLWLVPKIIAKLVMDWYINYLPHACLPPDKFEGTRIIDLPWFTPFVLFHNYHAVHHLWPKNPWHSYYKLYCERNDFIKKHGVPIEHRLSGFHASRKTGNPVAYA